MRFLSVCSGIEAASVAFEPLGFEPCLYSEIEKFPREVLAYRLGAFDVRQSCRARVPLWGDFTALRVRHFRRLGIPLPEVLIGGPPCQAFSIAGARRSLQDDRGNLTLVYVRFAHALRNTGSLRYLVYENVPGLLNTDDNAFGCFLGALVGADDPLLPGAKPRRGRSNETWRWREAGRWPVLDEEGNETGKFIERAEGHIPRWPSVGMASGPWARVAWRVLDAQYFGLAQRRKRVFVVAGFGDGTDPAEILFEPKSMQGSAPPRRKSRQDLAPTIPSRSSAGGGLGTDFDLDGGLIEVVGALQSGGTPNGHGTAGINRQAVNAGHVIPCFAIQERAVSENPDAGPDGVGVQADIAYTLEARQQVQAVAFGGNNCGGAIDCAKTLLGGGHANNPLDETLIAFSSKDHGADAACDIAPTLRAMSHAGSHANAGGQLAVAFALRGRDGGAMPEIEGDAVGALRAASGGSSRSYVAGVGVRRLTPKECSRLMGFPDDWCKIPRNGKPASECPDGPMYKAYGNSFAVPVISWIGSRIMAQHKRLLRQSVQTGTKG